MDRQNKKCSCARISGRKNITLELTKKRKGNWLGHWFRRNCLLKDALEGIVNRKKVHGTKRYEMTDIMINGPCADTRRKAEKRVEWRMLSLQ